MTQANDLPIVYVVDDDISIRDLMAHTVQSMGIEVKVFDSAEAFAGFAIPARPACLLLDLEMPGQSGIELLEKHFGGVPPCPVIFITGHASVPAAVKSMKLGAVDFLEKPFERETLIKLVQAAIEKDRGSRSATAATQDIRTKLLTLSPREKELLAAVIEGKSTKMIADELGISARTVDHHRANLMEKMGAANVADLVRMSLAGGFKA